MYAVAGLHVAAPHGGAEELAGRARRRTASAPSPTLRRSPVTTNSTAAHLAVEDGHRPALLQGAGRRSGVQMCASWDGGRAATAGRCAPHLAQRLEKSYEGPQVLVVDLQGRCGGELPCHGAALITSQGRRAACRWLGDVPKLQRQGAIESPCCAAARRGARGKRWASSPPMQASRR